jgi:hypothetical protein
MKGGSNVNKMKKLQVFGFIVLLISIVCYILSRFVFTLPDWFALVDIVLMTIAIFVTVFSSVRMTMEKKN